MSWGLQYNLSQGSYQIKDYIQMIISQDVKQKD